MKNAYRLGFVSVAVLSGLPFVPGVGKQLDSLDSLFSSSAAASVVEASKARPQPSAPAAPFEVVTVPAASPEPAVVPETVATALRPFEGTYVYAGDDSERAEVDAAIDAVVSEMSIFAREIARKRLSESNAIPGRLSVEPHPQGVAIAFDGRLYVAPIDGGTTRVVGVAGNELDYRVELGDEGLAQHFQGEDGARRNRLAWKGEHVTVSVEVSSDRLPEPVVYRLTYARAE